MSLNINVESVKLPYNKLNKKTIQKVYNKLEELLDLSKKDINLILTDDTYIHAINKEYRKKDKPTDVISFAYDDEPFPFLQEQNSMIGDIYISLETAIIQADEFNVTFVQEFTRLFIHGILHLLGFDHERSKKDEKIMFAKEDELFSEINANIC